MDYSEPPRNYPHSRSSTCKFARTLHVTRKLVQLRLYNKQKRGENLVHSQLPWYHIQRHHTRMTQYRYS
ncbi:unnamed protein product [Tuber melanosporum]|uniref:(Perigord truffle) hypothetical protein n=1 Tax=Tuber melanosporum (strain Mel28) TaxID=656061 RepID=D5GQ48_TUBMM|nr:uncharacterized protein GSTUM_00012197001 [Tuber melanosporum]CAZ86641.1 unnamed protein product [Tuber melanosporum]